MSIAEQKIDEEKKYLACEADIAELFFPEDFGSTVNFIAKEQTVLATLTQKVLEIKSGLEKW